MVEHDGGDGRKLQVWNETGKLDVFEDVLEGRLDATWVFLPWEGLEAEMVGREVQAWKLEDYRSAVWVCACDCVRCTKW